MSKDKLPYRPCVGIMLLNAENKVWIGKRRKSKKKHGHPSHWWQMPQGGVDEGENLIDAARRELTEETGVRSVEIIAKSADWLTYDLPEQMIGKVWKGRYRGQKQKWFAMRFLGNDKEIDISGVGHKPEFDQWRWAELDELPALIVEFKREVYEAVIAEFAHLAQA